MNNYLPLAIVTIITFALALIASIHAILKSFDKAKTLRIFLIGQPNSGKSVYLTTLFKELQEKTYSSGAARFWITDRETKERIENQLTRLKRWWLPPTQKNNAIHYKIMHYTQIEKVEIDFVDYSGAHIKEYDAPPDAYLQKNDYYNYAIWSDALILCIDGAILLSEDEHLIEESQSTLIEAHRRIIRGTNVRAPEKKNKTVALLVLKSDLFRSEDELLDLVKVKYRRLISHLNQSSIHYLYTITSVGYVVEGMPPSNLFPRNVTRPIEMFL